MSSFGRVAQLVRALVSHTRGPGFESLRDHARIDLAPNYLLQIHFLMTSNRLRLLVCSAFVLPAPALCRRAESTESDGCAANAGDPILLLLQQLRARILSSGLTPDQIRARLRAEGYPETLLDAYLPGKYGGARP